MKTFLHVVALIVILGVVGAVLFYVMQSRDTAKAPASVTRATTTDSVVKKCGRPIAVMTEAVQEEASSSPSVSAEYPQFPSLSLELNQTIRSVVLNRLQEFRKEAAESKIIPGKDFSFLARFEAVQANSSYVSLIIRFDSYTGGANENQDLQTFNYDVVDKKTLSLGDLFASGTDYLTAISSEARKQLMNKLTAAAGDASPSEMLINGTTPREENFKNFTFTDAAIQIYFPKYSVAAGALGEQQVNIPFASIGTSLDRSCDVPQL